MVSFFLYSFPQVCVSFARIGASLLLLRSAPLIGCRHLLSLTLTVSPSPALFSAFRLESSSPSPPPFLVLPFFRVGLCHTCLGGFPNPPSPLRYSASAAFHCFRLPAASGSFSLSRAPSSGRLLPPVGSPCSGVGCVWSFGFWGGGSLYPLFLFTTVASANFTLLPVASCFRLTLHPSSCLGSLFRLLYVI